MKPALARRSRSRDAQLRQALRFADSYTRMHALLSLAAAADFWTLVRDEWSGCDNIATCQPALVTILRRERDRHGFPILGAMSDDAAALYAELPQQVTVYRGCYTGNVYGLSWSLCKQTAARFPFLLRYRRCDPEKRGLLIEGRIRREDIAFIITDRSESEVVALPSDVTISAQQLAVDARN
jgi:hypothetical protein